MWIVSLVQRYEKIRGARNWKCLKQEKALAAGTHKHKNAAHLCGILLSIEFSGEDEI